jgi:hypothetical protein
MTGEDPYHALECTHHCLCTLIMFLWSQVQHDNGMVPELVNTVHIAIIGFTEYLEWQDIFMSWKVWWVSDIANLHSPMQQETW